MCLMAFNESKTDTSRTVSDRHRKEALWSIRHVRGALHPAKYSSLSAFAGTHESVD